MDTRLSAEQISLRDSAASISERFGPKTVQELDDRERRGRLESAVAASGWYEMRTANDDAQPWASAVEAAIVAEELGRRLADVAFIGPTLAAELRRLAGAPASPTTETVGLTSDLAELAAVEGDSLVGPAVGFDASGAAATLLLARDADRAWLAALPPGQPLPEGVDLTRLATACTAGAGEIGTVAGQLRALGDADIAQWSAFALALGAADLVGTMGGAVTLACEYARGRRQYGARIGSFQAVQHLLADAHVLTEGSRSVALHAAWAVDALAADEALVAASIAKAYCARAARTVCETAIQVHGGIGNTWECLAHLYLRRALYSSDLLGGVGASLGRVQAHYGIGGPRGFS